MACGTPVLAWERASVPEIVTPGETGYYGSSSAALAALVPQAFELDREAVRACARRRFSRQRMADDYEHAYAALLRRSARDTLATRVPS